MGRAGTVVAVFMTFAVLIGAFIAVDIVEQGRPATKTEPAPRFDLIEMPELETCGTNGEYRCMSDQDYMHLVGVIVEARHLIDNPRRPVCNQSGCLCAMDEGLK